MGCQKCEVRIRKRGALPSTDKWCAEKYDKFFVPSLMSDDEDELDGNGKRTGRFILRAPAYHVEEVSPLLCLGLSRR